VVDLLDCLPDVGRRRALAVAAALVGAGGQLIAHPVAMGSYVTTALERADARATESLIASAGSRVLVPDHPFLARRLAPQAQQLMLMGYVEVLWARKQGYVRTADGRTVDVDVAADVDRIDPEWVFLTDNDAWLAQLIARHYRPWCRFEPPALGYDVPASGLHLVYRRRIAPLDAAPSDAALAPRCQGPRIEAPVWTGFEFALASGFYAPGRPVDPLWLSGPRSTIALNLPEAGPVTLTLSVQGALLPDTMLTVTSAGRVIGERADPGKDLVVQFDAPSGVSIVTLEPDRWNRHPQDVAPTDPRPLSVALTRVRCAWRGGARQLFPLDRRAP
jgi:hypothetical protein